MRMMDQSQAFPRKVNFNQYQPLVEAASNASIGADKLPKVVVEDFDSSKLALKAANSIRNHARSNNLGLRVSCPEGSKTIYICKTNTPARTRKKKSAEAPAAPEAPAA